MVKASLRSAGVFSILLLLALVPRRSVADPSSNSWKWGDLPVFNDASYQLFSSHELSRTRPSRIASWFTDPGNMDFDNFLAYCKGPREAGLWPFLFSVSDIQYPCGRGEHGALLAEADGPGYLSRIWMTTFRWLGSHALFRHESISIFVDGQSAPAYRGYLKDWAKGDDAVFSTPLSTVQSGAWISYVPIPFHTHLKVFLDGIMKLGDAYYYQVGIQKLPTPAELPEGPAVLVPSSWNTDDPWADQTASVAETRARLAPGETNELLSLDGPGTLESLSFELPDRGTEALQRIELQLSWDDALGPAVKMPVSSFFGLELHDGDFASLPLLVERVGDRIRMVSRLPMPFRKKARITLRNLGDVPFEASLKASWAADLPQGSWGYFKASMNEVSRPVPRGARHRILEVSGPGKYVGTFLFMQGRQIHSGKIHDPFSFLEGNDLLTIDGGPTQSGTGTEDYFNSAWYFKDGIANHPLSGVNFKDRYQTRTARGSIVEHGAVSAYRWHILDDSISFQRSFKLEFQYGADHPESVDRYRSVAYFYSAGPSP